MRGNQDAEDPYRNPWFTGAGQRQHGLRRTAGGGDRLPHRRGGIEAFRTEFEQTLRRHGAGADGVLVLCDMECGTPYNVACRFAFDPEWPQPLAVVTGVNFPMLLMSADLLDAVDVHEAAGQLLVQGAALRRHCRD